MVSIIKVLISGFNEFLQESIRQELNEIGYELLTARDFPETLALFSTHIDIVILDMNLPRKFGKRNHQSACIEMAQKLRETNQSAGFIFYGTSPECLGEVENFFQQGEGGVGFIMLDASVRLATVLPIVLAGNWISVTAHMPHRQNIQEQSLLLGLSETPRQLVLYALEHIHSLDPDEIIFVSHYTSTNRSISQELHMSLSTVEAKFSSIYHKLGLDMADRRLRTVLLDRTLAIYAIRQKNHNS